MESWGMYYNLFPDNLLSQNDATIATSKNKIDWHTVAYNISFAINLTNAYALVDTAPYDTCAIIKVLIKINQYFYRLTSNSLSINIIEI